MWKKSINRIRNVYKIYLLIAAAMILMLSGCSFSNTSVKKVADLDYTVVEDEDVPKELKKIIDDKKENSLRLTYSTKDYMYIVAGYGVQPTSGYSIRLNEIYLGENAIYVDTNLIGPSKSETVSENPTTPYIVIKIEKRDEAVVFNV